MGGYTEAWEPGVWEAVWTLPFEGRVFTASDRQERTPKALERKPRRGKEGGAHLVT